MICFLLLIAGVDSIGAIFSMQESFLSLKGSIEIEVISGGSGVSAVIRNNGAVNLTNISWSVHLNEGLIFFGKKAEGTILRLRPDKTETVKIPMVIGFGKTTITALVQSSEGSNDERSVQARVRLFKVRIIPGSTNALTIQLERVARGLHAPTVLTNARDGSNRLFVGEQTGAIFIIENGILLSTPFLDLSEKIVNVNPIYDERGLLGLVFHPEYENNGRFFVYYSAPKSEPGIDHESIVAEYHVSADPNRADPTSERVVFRVDQPEANHNGGHLAFGPDGFLYIGLGDGGGAGDQHGILGNGQDINTTLGKILRIDVDSSKPYAIPDDNPYVGENGLDEIYALGFRNPYKFSFDRGTGRLFAADVGQDVWEEIDIVENGGNYGWRILEGNHPYDLALAELLGINISTLQPPIHEYSHNIGRSIIGGYVYQGTQYPDLVGKYVFGDWSTDFVKPDGRLYYLDEIQPNEWKRFEFKLNTDKPLKKFILGFGEAENGELYVLTTKILGSLFPSGEVWHIRGVYQV